MKQPTQTPSAPSAYPSPVPASGSGQPQPYPAVQPQVGLAQIPPQLVAQPLVQPGQNPQASIQMQPVQNQPVQMQPGQVPPTQMPPMGAPQPMVPQQNMRPPQAMPPQPHPGIPSAGMSMGGQIPYSPAPQHIPEPLYQQSEKEGGERILPRISIHAFCENSQTAGAVQAMTNDWRMARANLKVYMGGIAAATEYYANETTPSLVMFESSLRGEALYDKLDALASVVDSGTKVVMIGASNDIRLYRELMEKGLSDYIVPPFHPLSFIRAISELYSDPDKPYIGRVVAFFGAKGGVGSSTLAHNVAWGLANSLGQETALIDMDSSWGTTGLDFNYDNTQGLEEALADADRLDENLLDNIMVRHSEKLSILPAAASLGSPTPSSIEAYEMVVKSVRSLSPLTILDMPHVWSEWSSQTLVSADDVVITATPDLANLRNTKNLVDFLKAARPNDAPPLLVLNKTGVPKTAEIPVKDFAAAVGIDPALVLAYEPVMYTEAANDGKMLSELKAAASAFEGILYLAQRVRTGHFSVQQNSKTGKKSKSRKRSKKTADTDGNESSSIFAKFKKRKK
ncbi:MAG: pilus assembly protein CpaE [Robiginitomaculum sp.]|nr:MAG: pilus assembly protein CpaE [Robiginitomaculum sp.]